MPNTTTPGQDVLRHCGGGIWSVFWCAYGEQSGGSWAWPTSWLRPRECASGAQKKS
eukprot:CAMPEP_0119360718 /NCGR_PEP_ID=MMETSP1334-20130426/8240_1 /TAXON_ID=127549 /ORGANISM="Calcidiscus leptoporus, Strain RCC1130" /LENGTH=55 /DNA_ID=CAMNT_0007375603 /DNA_START=94 /DNA_END=257 /DNA_ORIENTATION=-